MMITFLTVIYAVTTSSALLSSNQARESDHLYNSLNHPTNWNVRPLISNIRPSIVFFATKQTGRKQATDDDEKTQPDLVPEGIRLNKVFKATHSRRKADVLIESGRVSVNGKRVLGKGGFRVIPYKDVVKLDDVEVTGWEEMNAISTVEDGKNDQEIGGKSTARLDDGVMSHFEYVKYWKPCGVTCTTDSNIKDNIIDAISQSGYRPKHRVYPIGRLDKETSGLILLTSDGRVPNAVLRGEKKQGKVYQVFLDRDILDRDINTLRNGIIITTVAQRDGKRAKPLTQRTKKCNVERLGPRTFEITLIEGRNRQIRKMVGALNYTVVRLHRINFMGVSLQSKGESVCSVMKKSGDWAYLNNKELSLVRNALIRK